MGTVATPTDDGNAFILNGDKQWCTNVTDPKTTLIAVLARTPDKQLPNGKTIPQISCFVVETRGPASSGCGGRHSWDCAASPMARSPSRTSGCPRRTSSASPGKA
ncbi:MAG: hypothetical protein IPJ97_12025 [Proteobacteria bacterium]|nr:hypothetical protein [Pseudomonadota bacterium]